MGKRIFSTVLLWAVLFFVLFFGGTVGCFGLLFIATMLTQYEFYQLLRQANYKPVLSWGLFLGTCLQLGCALTELAVGELFVMIVAVSCLLASLKHSVQFIQQSLLPTLIGIIYIPFMLSFVVKFVHGYIDIAQPQAVSTILLLIAISKFSDVGGLLIGCRFGRHKIVPDFSPNKTFEGLLGGIMASVIVGVGGFLIFQNYLLPQLTLFSIVALSIILSITSPIGDITESAVKRIAEVKDSGRIIPGIGGIFDLTDSLIFSLPLGIIFITHIVL